MPTRPGPHSGPPPLARCTSSSAPRGWAAPTWRACGRSPFSTEIGAVVAPNFALGAVLLGYLAHTVARHFDYAEIVEAHHEAKKDSPSGTALALARALAAGRKTPFQRPVPEKETLPGTRGGDSDGVTIHAMRMPGRLAHHEIVLGTQGQTLTLRHDTVNRECYMPGVLAAVRKVRRLRRTGGWAGEGAGPLGAAPSRWTKPLASRYPIPLHPRRGAQTGDETNTPRRTDEGRR